MVKTLLRRVYTNFATRVLDVPSKLLAFLLFLLLLFMPLSGPGSYILSVLILANIWAIFAASWDILVRAGQVSFGHALFFGVGAYTSAFLSAKFFNFPPWISIPLSLPIGILVALLVGFPCLRVKGPYLAIVTLAFPLILIRLVFYFKEATGGEHGIAVPRLFPFLSISEQGVAEYYLSLLLLAVSSIALYKIANSKTGIVFVSILDDESASKASGINTTKYKLLAFVISAFFASLAGGFYAHYIRSANWPMLSLIYSFPPIIMTILGGIGTIYGPIVGAYIIVILPELFGFIPEFKEWSLVIYVVLVVLLIIKWPTGVARWVVEKLEELTEERELEEREKEKKK